MCPDLSNLKLVEEDIDVADESTYVDATEFPPPIPEGTYTFIQGKPTFEATKAGFLSATMDQTVAGGEHDGAKVMFDRVSAKTFERGGVKVSMLTDQLRAIGDKSTKRTNAERAEALEAGEGKSFKAVVQWDGYCGHKGTSHEGEDAFSVKGAKNFPAGGDAICPKCGSQVRPRARINRRISA